MPRIFRSTAIFAGEQGLILRGVRGTNERSFQALEISYESPIKLSSKETTLLSEESKKQNLQASKTLTIFGIIGMDDLHPSTSRC